MIKYSDSDSDSDSSEFRVRHTLCNYKCNNEHGIKTTDYRLQSDSPYLSGEDLAATDCIASQSYRDTVNTLLCLSTCI